MSGMTQLMFRLRKPKSVTLSAHSRGSIWTQSSQPLTYSILDSTKSFWVISIQYLKNWKNGGDVTYKLVKTKTLSMATTTRTAPMSWILRNTLYCCHQRNFFGRNISWASPKTTYFYYKKICIYKIKVSKKKIDLILKKPSLVATCLLIFGIVPTELQPCNVGCTLPSKIDHFWQTTL